MAAAVSDIEKLEVEVEVQCSATKFYRMFKYDVKEIPKHVPHLYQSVQVLEGDGISAGTLKLWTYQLEGKQYYVKERTVVDDEKRMITHCALEGELMKHYKFFNLTCTVDPKGGPREGSVVKWHIEYVKLHEHSPIPAKYIELVVCLTKALNEKLHDNQHGHSHSVGPDNIEKIEVEVEVPYDADKFYNMFKHDVKEIPKIVPHLYEHVEVLEGDGINAGSVKLWKYLLDDKLVYRKERMKIVDDEKRMITHSLFDGEIMKDYTFFDVTFTVTPKGCPGEGSVVKWHVEYVKAHEDAHIPTDYIDHIVWLTKDLSAHLHKDV